MANKDVFIAIVDFLKESSEILQKQKNFTDFQNATAIMIATITGMCLGTISQQKEEEKEKMEIIYNEEEKVI